MQPADSESCTSLDKVFVRQRYDTPYSRLTVKIQVTCEVFDRLSKKLRTSSEQAEHAQRN